MPVASSAASVVSGSLPKWQLALAVGAPVALGLGYMYYKTSTQSKSKGSGKVNGTDKQISIDSDSPGKTSSDKSEVRIYSGTLSYYSSIISIMIKLL